MQSLSRDLRHTLRALGRNPGFTLVALLTLALGIGANSAVFSVVDAVLLRPLPYPESGRIVRIWNFYTQRDTPRLETAEEEFLDYKSQGSRLFSELGAFVSVQASLAGEEQPARVQATYATAGFFPVLGVSAALGRTYGPEEDRPGAQPVVVISHGLWQRHFGSDPGIVNRSTLLNGRSVTVLGVMPPGFDFPEETDVWSPLGIDPANLTPRTEHYLAVVGRLAPGVSVQQAQAEMSNIAGRFGERFPNQYPPDSGWGVNVVPLLEELVGDTRPQLLILLAAVSLVLLIACVNVANLLLARAQTREREMAVRVALGASRGRLLVQSMVEGVVLALAGGLLGLILARAGVAAILAIYPDALPRAGEIEIDGRMLAVTLLVGLLTGLVLGLIPAFRALRPDVQAVLKASSGKATGSVGQNRFRRALVGLEVALALVLLIGAGLLVKSFSLLRQVDPGFRADRLLTLELSLPRGAYPEDLQASGFYNELIGRLEALPGVAAASSISYLPFSSGIDRSATVGPEGMSYAPGDPLPEPKIRSVDYRYFRTMGIPLIEGRELNAGDNPSGYPVAVIDEVLARRLWPGQQAAGKRLKMGPPTAENPNPWVTIAGVVGEAKQSSLADEPQGVVYFPQLRRAERGQFLVIRSAGDDPLALAEVVRQQVHGLDPSLPVSDLKIMEQWLNASFSKPRFAMWLMTVFAVVALVLAAIGIYGVVSYMVHQRTHEIGIRMALGAGRPQILRHTLLQGMTVVLAGVVLGLAAAFLLTRAMTSLLYRVEARDPATFVAVPFLLIAVAVLANFVPARRATRVEPATALRYD